ncbi:uncharacterized protein [Dermacentor andersoni]|uniref:uncharacterized protein isoform X2 n=1 Tax=Dermacentor andersoni TaxID=34620 RepID=UPI002417D26F|nr:uncharacterized protein LOC126520662 isoform X2 [Dermacentor andersoni]
MSDPDAIMFLRLRYDALLATNNNMEKLVDCPDLVVFRTENHELSTRVLRAPNPYRRYIGADMAELFLQQELDKISLLRKPLDGQEWCLSFALGGLLFRYHLGLSFGDDAQTGPQEISLSEVCERFSVRRFEDLRTLSFYAMEHTKHTWVAFDDDWSLTRKVDEPGGDVAGGDQRPSGGRQLDLGFGIYEMCPFPLSFMHACETSDQCKQTGCCAMHAFPGTRRWQRPCCVVSRLVTLARLTGSCIKSKATRPESDDD